MYFKYEKYFADCIWLLILMSRCINKIFTIVAAQLLSRPQINQGGREIINERRTKKIKVLLHKIVLIFFFFIIISLILPLVQCWIIFFYLSGLQKVIWIKSSERFKADLSGGTADNSYIWNLWQVAPARHRSFVRRFELYFISTSRFVLFF